jgi:hypothetical protein
MFKFKFETAGEPFAPGDARAMPRVERQLHAPGRLRYPASFGHNFY